MIKPDDVILFQGDSITDAGRDRNDPAPNSTPALGRGYAMLTAAALLAEHHNGLKVYNRGISGNQVTHLTARWQPDCLDLQPTVLSILIGVNDTWHGTAKGAPGNGTSLEVYEATYRKILDDALAALPGLRVVLCEPFVLQAGAVLVEMFQPEIDHRRAIVRKLADDYNATFVPFHTEFDKASKKVEPAYWAHDGVHPTLAGHQFMARTWIRTVCG